MRIRISHRTTYHYAAPVWRALQLLRLTPRSSEGQFVRSWRVVVDADVRLDRGEDAYGNITHMVYIDGPFTALEVLVEGEVDTSDTGGFVHGTMDRVPRQLFLRTTPLTAPTEAIRAFARESVASEGGDTLAGLHRIAATLHTGMRFEVGATSAGTTAGEAFAAQTGVCQDFAHVFVAAARSLGVPARYVNGYMLRTDGEHQEAGHAWAEAYLPDLGWIAFDPANGVCATERHVRVAIGSDSNDAAPVRGSRAGGSTERLAVAVTVAERVATPQRPLARLPSQSQQQ